MRFTTSWDDGYALDLPLAEMLRSHGCMGTFYVAPVQQHGQAMLTEADLKTLAQTMEIGAHSLTHPKLATIPADDAKQEIQGSKKRLEDILQKPCTMFCYPKGNYNDAVKTLVKVAGYKGARTVEPLCFDMTDPFAMPTSLQVYPFPWRAAYRKWWHVFDPLSGLRAQRKRLNELGIPWKDRWSWLSLAKALFTKAIERNEPVFHLWGHSAEVQRLGLWNDLDAFLAFVATHPNVEHVTNGDLLPDRI